MAIFLSGRPVRRRAAGKLLFTDSAAADFEIFSECCRRHRRKLKR